MNHLTGFTNWMHSEVSIYVEGGKENGGRCLVAGAPLMMGCVDADSEDVESG